MFAGNFAPAGWMFCEGQLAADLRVRNPLQPDRHDLWRRRAVAPSRLPDLRGRVPLHFGNGFTLAETGGAETITLTVSQIPAHTHPFLATSSFGRPASPTNNVLAQASRPSRSTTQRDADQRRWLQGRSSSIGGSQPHNNFQPYLCVDFIISLFGIFPSQT